MRLPDDSELTLAALGTLGTVILVFFNLPQAINRWTPILDSLSPLILNGLQNLLLVLFAFTTGWLARTKYQTPVTPEIDEEGATEEHPTLDSLVGCVQVDDAVWRGVAEFSDLKVESVDVSRKPRCPQCQKVMTRESYQLTSGGRTSPLRSPKSITRKKWECPDGDCGFTADRENGQYREARQLFKGFVQDIVESTDTEYSLENLINRIDGEATPEGVWEEYAKTVENTHITTKCFR